MRGTSQTTASAGTIDPGAPEPLARTPWWRRGYVNGGAIAALALAAILLLHAGELPGLGRILSDLPACVAVSAAVHLPQIALTALGWRALLPRELRPSFAAMATLRWFREAANTLLPAGALVGLAAAARLLSRRGVPADTAGATATVDLTAAAPARAWASPRWARSRSSWRSGA